uniref:Beta sliding clamp n=1 Tax=candidate division WOR-3 bacterium TaxID=2052148 RepID=A0A7C3YZU8_UNCW3
MNFEIPREVFLEKLETALPVVPTRTNFPVLQNIVIDINQDKISFLATDLDTSIQLELLFPEPRDLPTTKLIIRARELVEILREMSEPAITFEMEENILRLKAGKGEYTFSLLDPQEFPDLPSPPKEEEFEFPLSLLFELFTDTAFTVAKEAGQPALSGVLWEIREKETRMVATDGHRLALVKKEGNFGKVKKIQAIIPPKPLELLPKTGTDKIKISLNSTLISFRGEDYQITSRLIEGPYPDYEKVLPTKYPYCLSGSREELSNTINRMLVFAPRTTRLVVFNLQKKGSFLEASSEIGISKEEIKGEYKGEELKVGFNGYLLNEILRHIRSEEVDLELASATQALVIRPKEEGERKEKLFLLMPMRLE